MRVGAGPVAALAALVALGPGCGKRADPLPPLRLEPRPVGQPQLAQRGDVLELSAKAPEASVDGVALQRVEIEWLTTDRDGRFETVALAERHPAQPGASVLVTRALPTPGTTLRAAARAVAGRRESRLGRVLTLRVEPPVPAPTDLQVAIDGASAQLSWTLPDALAARLAEPTPSPTPLAGPPGIPVAPTSAANATPSPEPAAESAGVPTPQPPPGDTARDQDAPPATAAAAPGGSPRPAPSPEGAEPVTASQPPAPGGSAPVPVPVPGASPSPTPSPPPERGVWVYRRRDGGEYEQPLNRVPLLEPQFRDAGVTVGASYCYEARGVLSTSPVIESEPSNEACLEMRDVVAPAAPVGVTVLAVEGGLEVSWSRSAEEDLAGYRIDRLARNRPRRIGEVGPEATRFLDEEPPRDARVVYTVTAVDTAGNESPPTETEPVETP